jgi:hypothetical protein
VPTTQISCAGPLFVSVNDPAEGSTNPLRFTVGGGCDFSFGSVTPATQTVLPGAVAAYQIVLNPAGSNGNAVELSCPTPTAGISCTFNPNPVTPVQGGTTVMLTITAPAIAAAPYVRVKPFDGKPGRYFAFGTSFAILLIMFLTMRVAFNTNAESRRASQIRAALSLTALVFLLTLMAACGGGSGGGGGGGGGGQTHIFTISIQGVSQNFQHLTSVQLVVD